MFDVSWNDPSRETVGQRKTRKDKKSNGVSRGSSVRSSESSGSRASKASKASDATTAHSKPSLFGFFGGTKKPPVARSGSQSRLSALNTNTEQNVKASRRISSYIPPEPSSPQPTTTTRITEHDDFVNRHSYHDTEMSSPSDGKQPLRSRCWTDIARLSLFGMDWTIKQDRLFLELGRPHLF